MAGYSATPLPAKLGITPGSRVLVRGAPAGFELADLPDGVRLGSRISRTASYDVIVLFCPDVARMTASVAPLVPALQTAGGLWVCWPKRSSGVATDLTETAVRAHGLATGLVDVKVAAIDDTWSGLRFVRRLADR